MPDYLVVRNADRGRELGNRVERATSLLDRFRGLMLRRSLPAGGGMLIRTTSIHTFFMRFPIDVLYLDGDGQILRATPAMAPSRIGPLLTRGCRQVLELPAGTIESTRSQVGDRLVVEPAG